MKYDKKTRLKALFLKNQSNNGFDPDEIYSAVDYIAEHIFTLFHAARSHKDQYGSIVSLLVELMDQRDVALYEEDMTCRVKKSLPEKKQHHANSIVKTFVDLFRLYKKEYSFYQENFSLVFLAKNQKQHENYMEVVSSIFKKHIDELSEEVKAEIQLNQKASGITLSDKKDEEEKEVDSMQQSSQKISTNKMANGGI